MDISIKETVNSKQYMTQNIHIIWDNMKIPNLIKIGIEEGD